MKSIAKAEIALITESLFRFHTSYGDYPITEGIENNEITITQGFIGVENFQTLTKWLILKMSHQKE